MALLLPQLLQGISLMAWLRCLAEHSLWNSHALKIFVCSIKLLQHLLSHRITWCPSNACGLDLDLSCFRASINVCWVSPKTSSLPGLEDILLGQSIAKSKGPKLSRISFLLLNCVQLRCALIYGAFAKLSGITCSSSALGCFP